ncbi:MAG: DUF6152 family protein [Bryobacteraceae bacterium]
MRRYLAAAGFLAALPLLAHHSIPGAYFTDQNIRIEGTLVEFNFRDPHTFLGVSGKDPKTGTPATINLEWGSIQRLGRDGINKDTLKVGDHLVIVGSPSRKQGDPVLFLMGVRRQSDGWKWGRTVQ